MPRGADARAVLFCAALTLLVACAARVARDEQGAKRPPSSWPGRVAGILQPGWEVLETGNSIVIARKEPVSFYNPIGLPASLNEERPEVVKQAKFTEQYQITLEIVDRLPDERYEELRGVNWKAEEEFQALESRMRGFMGKGDYLPRTPGEVALYEEYKSALVNLPYHRLPDLYDEKHSVYVKTSRHRWGQFYSAREELECRAVLENIYSFAEVYEGKKPGTRFREYEREAVFEAFESGRAYDSYLHKREENLEGQRGR